MAIYHFSMKPVSRAKGRSAVASMAYRAGEKLTNERDGLVHDYTRKQGVEHAEIVLPEGVNAKWARDRSTLWNAAEFAEPGDIDYLHMMPERHESLGHAVAAKLQEMLGE